MCQSADLSITGGRAFFGVGRFEVVFCFDSVSVKFELFEAMKVVGKAERYDGKEMLTDKLLEVFRFL